MAICVAGQDIGQSILIHIGNGHCRCGFPRWKRARFCETSRAIPDQHGDAPRNRIVGHNQVYLAVQIQVCRSPVIRVRVVPNRVASKERPVPFPQVDKHRVPFQIARDQIGLPIPVYIREQKLLRGP